MRKNSQKNNRINAEVQRALSTIIRNEVKDPRVSVLTSITAVEVAPDLKTAKIYISTFDKKITIEETVQALNNAAGFIRHELSNAVDIRNTPQLTFYADHSIEYGINMSAKIDEVLKGQSE